MNVNGSAVSERINEAMSVCARTNPIYGEISNYSLALYVLGSIDAPDIMSAQDIDMEAASAMLKENFKKIDESEIPHGYCATGSDDRYLLVLGDPLFPDHFAVLVDNKSNTPYFSKLPHWGSGLDSVEELRNGFFTEKALGRHDIHYYRATRA